MSVESHTFCAQVSGLANAERVNNKSYQRDCLNDGRSCVNNMVNWQIVNNSLVAKIKVRQHRGTWVPNPADLPENSVLEKYQTVDILLDLES